MRNNKLDNQYKNLSIGKVFFLAKTTSDIDILNFIELHITENLNKETTKGTLQ